MTTREDLVAQLAELDRATLAEAEANKTPHADTIARLRDHKVHPAELAELLDAVVRKAYSLDDDDQADETLPPVSDRMELVADELGRLGARISALELSAPKAADNNTPEDAKTTKGGK